MSQAPPPYPGEPQKSPYPPQQPGYPPQGYPPQGYPPQSGYQQQPGYPPQQGYPAAQPYPAGQAQHTTTIIQQQPTTTFISPAFFGETPVSMICPHCQASIVTATEYVPGSCAWIICVVLFFVFWPCCWLPFVIDGCKDVLHSCPNCRRQVGAFRRM